MILPPKKIAVIGVESPEGLGDALQSYVAVKLLNSILPESTTTFICPQLSNHISVFKHLKLDAQLSSATLTDTGLLNYAIHSLIPYKRAHIVHGRITDENRNGTVERFIDRLREIVGMYIDSSLPGKHIGSSIAKSMFSFDAAIFAGHTICFDLHYFLTQYENVRSIVKGPIVTSPISISNLTIEKNRARTLLLKRLKQSLQKLDYIYVRGSNSLGILRDQLNIDEARIGMALDSGFGMRLICQNINRYNVLRTAALRLIIIPRKQLFYDYQRIELYKSYLNTLASFILWISREFDAEIHLVSHNLNSNPTCDRSAVEDLVRLLQQRNRTNSRSLNLKITYNSNIIDAYRLYSSADLVITSRMHGGIMALSAGIPTFFFLPSEDTKTLDILSFLGLDINRFLIEMFDVNELKAERFINRIINVAENLEYYKRSVKFAVDRTLHTVQFPINTLTKLMV